MGLFKKIFGKKNNDAPKVTVTQEPTEEPKKEEIKKEPVPKGGESTISRNATENKKATPKKTVTKPAQKTENKAVKKTEHTAEEIAKDEIVEKSVDEIDAEFKESMEITVSDEIIIEEKAKGRALARFEIKKSKDNRFVFNLYAPNRVIVATSQIYSSSPSAINGIKSIMTNAPKAPIEDSSLKDYTELGFPKWQIYSDKGGQYRFRLYAPNGSCIVHSQGYTTKASCKNGIASIVKNAPDALISKTYLKKEENNMF